MTSVRQSTMIGRPNRAMAAAAIVSAALLLAACGGDGGGGGGGGQSDFVIRVAIANETAEPATLQVNDSEPQMIESCKGDVFLFSLPATDWVLTVNGETAVDSLEIAPNYLDKNLVADLWLYEDATLEVKRVEPGSNITTPPRLIICT